MNRRVLIQAFVIAALGILVAVFMRSREARERAAAPPPPAATEESEEPRAWTADLPIETTADWRADLPRLLVFAGANEPSRDMKPAVDRLAAEYEDRAVVAYLDLPVHMDMESSAARVFPTTVLIDRYGNEVWRKEGFLPAETLEVKLKEICR